MTTWLECLNNAGARERLTLGALYRVVAVRGQWLVVVDDRGDRLVWHRQRFTPVTERAKEEYERQTIRP